MLILLLVSTILLTVLSFFLFKKNLLSPSFILCLVFTGGSAIALFGNEFFWKEQITYKGPVLIIVCLILFIIGELIVSKFLFRNLEKTNKNVTSTPPEIKIAIWQILSLCLVFIVCLALNYLLYKATYNTAYEFGYRGINFLTYVRNAMVSGMRLPIYATIPDFFVQGVGFVSIFLGVRQYFGGKKRWSLLYVLPVVPLLISQLLSAGRNGFVLDVVLLLVTIYYFGVVVYKKMSLCELVLVSIIALNIFLVVFFGLGLIRNKSFRINNVLLLMCDYGGSSIVALDKSLNIEGLFTPGIFGSYTFNGFYGLFTKIFPSVNAPFKFLSSVVFKNGIKTNIYTTFASFFIDFGLFGCLFMSLLSGVVFSILSNFLMGKKSTFFKLLYFYYCYSLVRGLFNSVFGMFLSVSEIAHIFMMLVFYLLFTYSGRVVKSLKNHKIAGDIIFAFIAQTVSFLLSLVMSLIVPKMLNVTEYSYWQLFMFYSNYVGIFHLGFIDGIYLRFGGKKKDELNRNNLTSQFIVFAASQIILSAITCLIWCPLVGDAKRIYVILFTALYLIFSNLGLFFGYIFQAIGRVKTYSFSLFLEKALFLVSIIFLLIFKVDNGLIFVLLYVVFRLVFFLYLMIMSRHIVLAKPIFERTTFSEMWFSTKRGFSLMLASLASMLIMGISRALIDSVWGLETFGKFSFSISLCSFAIAFLSQISMVFFPALRQIDENKRIATFTKMKTFALLFLPLSYFAYYLLKILVTGWLPDYAESIAYIAFLLPICIYDGKMQMIMTTYFKVMNKEKPMLFVNLISLAISSISAVLFAYVFNNMIGVIVSAVVGIAIRCIISDYYLSKLTKTNFWYCFAFESAITVIFLVTTTLLPDWASFVIVLLAYVSIVIVERKTVVSLYKTILNKVSVLTTSEG